MTNTQTKITKATRLERRAFPYNTAGNYSAVAFAKHSDFRNVSLYCACRDLVQAAACGELTDASHVRSGNRAVAYWNPCEGRIKAMFGATEEEREAIEDYRMTASIVTRDHRKVR